MRFTKEINKEQATSKEDQKDQKKGLKRSKGQAIQKDKFKRNSKEIQKKFKRIQKNSKGQAMKGNSKGQAM